MKNKNGKEDSRVDCLTCTRGLTHRQQHVVADLDGAAGAHRPAVDYLGPHGPKH